MTLLNDDRAPAEAVTAPVTDRAPKHRIAGAGRGVLVVYQGHGGAPFDPLSARTGGPRGPTARTSAVALGLLIDVLPP